MFFEDEQDESSTSDQICDARVSLPTFTYISVSVNVGVYKR